MGEFFRNLWDRVARDYAERLDIKQWSLFAQHLIDSIFILLVAALMMAVARRLAARVTQKIDRFARPAQRKRIETVTSLALSTVRYTVYIGATLWILTVWGVPRESLLVGSAVIGAAIGFGSQGLVQDIITGLSILFEEQLAVGDFVEINGKAGAVEEVGLRVVKLRDAQGAQHVIFNRTIGLVSNFTSGAVHVLIDVTLADGKQADPAKTLAQQVTQDLARELPYFAGMPVVEGATQTSTGEVFLRINLRILPQQDAVVRGLFVDRLKRVFAASGINIPADGVRVIVLSDLFRRAIVSGAALNTQDKQLEGAV